MPINKVPEVGKPAVESTVIGLDELVIAPLSSVLGCLTFLFR